MNSVIRIRRIPSLLSLLIFTLIIIVCGIGFRTHATVNKKGDIQSTVQLKRIIEKYYPQCRLSKVSDLDKGLQEYLKQKHLDWHSGFVDGDFNGDQIPDYALLIRCGVTGKLIEKFVVLLGKADGSFQKITIAQWDEEPYFSNLILKKVPAGEKIEAYVESDKPVIRTLKLPGIELILSESASQVYYWENGKFNYIQTED